MKPDFPKIPLSESFIACMMKFIFFSLGLLNAKESRTVDCEDVTLRATVCARGGVVYRVRFNNTPANPPKAA